MCRLMRLRTQSLSRWMRCVRTLLLSSMLLTLMMCSSCTRQPLADTMAVTPRGCGSGVRKTQRIAAMALRHQERYRLEISTMDGALFAKSMEHPPPQSCEGGIADFNKT